MEGDAEALRVLMVEDSPADAELVLRSLREIGRPIEHTRVATEAALRQALAEFAPDVILSDFAMPTFSGPEALRICSEEAADIPFLFVSGTIGEERAIEALQRGAADYVLKDNLKRLPSAVRRAIHVARNRLQREEMENALRESEERFRNIIETSQDLIWEMGLDGSLTYINPAVTKVLGYAAQDVLGHRLLEYICEEDCQEAIERMTEFIVQGQGWRRWPLRWRHCDGSVRVLENSGLPQFDARGRLVGFRGVNHDITERLQQEAKIQQLARLQAVLAGTSRAVLRAQDRDTVLVEVCRVAVEKGGFLAACIGLPAEDGSILVPSHHGDERVTAMIAEIGRHVAGIRDPAQQSAGKLALREHRNVLSPDLATDPVLPEWVRTRMQEVGVAAQAVLPIGEPPWGLLGLYTARPQAFDEEEVALFERLASEIDFAVDFIAKGERLEFLAYHNPVSGLYNRAAFHDRLQPLLQREPQTVALVDIQRFTAINNSRGRVFGDKLLQQAGQRLRALAGAGALVAHLEAETFAFAYRTTGTREAEVDRLETMMQDFEREPFEIGGEEIRVDLCGGLAFAPEHGTDPEPLEHAALAALEDCNKRGLRVHVFNDELRDRATRRLALELELRHAIERQEFELFYQPKFEGATQRLVGAEALLRWRHPQRGLVSPADFIPLLEESALIVPVGHWVMAEALRTALGWRERHPGLRIAVNVSARELRHARFLDEVRAMLLPHVDDQLLDIEVTESMLMDDIDTSMHLLDSLRDLGCKVAIDDFGTGYSSLNYLARLPADTIKIDQSFISVLTESPQTLALVTNIISLAHSLSLDVVAEGVEEEGQAQLLRLLRCDVLQGYLLGRPVPAAAFAAQFLDIGNGVAG